MPPIKMLMAALLAGTCFFARTPRVRADDEPAPTPPPPTQISGSVYLTTAFPTMSVDGIPPDFNRAAYDLPVIAGANVVLSGTRTGIDAFGDLHGGSQTYGFDPLWGGSFGLGFHSKIHDGTLAVKMGVALEDQATLQSSPVGGSYLDIWRWGFLIQGEYTKDVFQPFASFHWFYTPDVTISNFEGIPTDVARNATYAFTLGLRLRFPVLLAEASINAYSLGATAIGSKEFAYFIGQQNAYQPEVGIGADLGEGHGKWEAWLRYTRTFPVRNDDATEYLYQAPAYYNDNLMVRGQLIAEVKWKF